MSFGPVCTACVAGDGDGEGDGECDTYSVISRCLLCCLLDSEEYI